MIKINWLIDSIGNSVVCFFIGMFLTWIISKRKSIIIQIDTIFNLNNEYRISASYLFRIKLKNRYLLIKGRRINQFQPVGGVYKYYDSFKNQYDKMQLRPESDSSNFYEEQDLRVYVKGKHLLHFIKWFNTKENREYNVTREFYEELVSSNILSEFSFENVKFEFIKNITTPIRKSTHFNCKEILIYDVFDVNITNDDVIKQLNEYIKNNDDIIFVEWDNILRECVTINNTSYQIGSHTKHIK